MAHSKRNRSLLQSSDDDLDEQYTPSQSQSEALGDKDVKKVAGQVCNVLLVAERKKFPVKSADIKRSIKLMKSRSTFQNVMKTAEEMMRDVFGFKIVPVKTNSYIVVNTMGDSFIKYQQLSKNDEYVRGVLIVTLIAIFMSEGKISAESLKSYLKILDVDVTTTAKATIQKLVRKKYLYTTLEDSSDPPKLMYQWGERANAEFSKKDILKFACKVYGNDVKPSEWTYQWRIVKGETANDEA